MEYSVIIELLILIPITFLLGIIIGKGIKNNTKIGYYSIDIKAPNDTSENKLFKMAHNKLFYVFMKKGCYITYKISNGTHRVYFLANSLNMENNVKK